MPKRQESLGLWCRIHDSGTEPTNQGAPQAPSSTILQDQVAADPQESAISLNLTRTLVSMQASDDAVVHKVACDHLVTVEAWAKECSLGRQKSLWTWAM